MIESAASRRVFLSFFFLLRTDILLIALLLLLLLEYYSIINVIVKETICMPILPTINVWNITKTLTGRYHTTFMVVD